MIEATCGACGTVVRIAEADVPTGAKFVTCASCKSRVALPQGKAASGAKPPAVPGKAPPPSPANKPSLDLADLPAPKRSTALSGAEASKPAPKSSLAGAELPAPKGAKSAASTAVSSLDLDDLMAPSGAAGLSDLPAPKPRASALGDAPASKPAPSALADLPAPKAKPSPLADLPAPKAKPSALADLPAPKSKAPPVKALDLAASKAPTRDLGDIELGASKAPARELGDLELDLPAPKGGGKGSLDLDDLPAPKSGGGGGGAGTFELDLDLPAPAGGGRAVPSTDSDLDLPAPKAGITDLPAPKPGGPTDLPAPKGFFDDLPQPAKKGGGGSVDLPAPKGFFDDLPAPSATAKSGGAGAKGGFFDDLPAPATPKAAKAPEPAAAKGGFFDDLPQPAKGTAATALAGAATAPAGGAGLFDDLEAPAAKQGDPDGIALSAGDIDLGPLASDTPIQLDGGPSEMDIGLPLGGDQQFSELDLGEPSARKPSAMPDEPASPIKIKSPGKGGGTKTPIAINVKKDEKQELKLDLADDPHEGKGGAAATVSAKGGTAGAKKPKGSTRTPEELAEDKARAAKRQRFLLAGFLGVALLGAGGFYFYRKHTAEVARRDEIAASIGNARRQLADANPQHWQRASQAASRALELAPTDGVALGLAAEATLAGALDTGMNFDARVKQGRKLAQDGLGAGKSGPELERAQALMHIAANEPDRALPILQKLAAKAPKDGWLNLYLGWAQLAKGDSEAALKAFDIAATNQGAKVPALYGTGRAKLLKADIEGARAAFASVLDLNKDHIGAQVGLAATLPPQQSAQKEADLMSVLQRPEVQKNQSDPRAVVQAYDLAGDIARTSGRLDIARERYRKALAIFKLDIPAHVGLATVELTDNKVQVAADSITKALAADANNPEVQLLAAELDIKQGKLPDAATKLETLATREPPLPTLLGARMHVIKGKLLDAQGKTDEAIAEYTAGAKIAGELDLAPTMTAVTRLTEAAKKETDPAKAEDYRARATQLLSALAERAKEDGELSLALGVAYLQAGDAVKAEESLRRATTLREKDPEAKLQLAKALNAQKRVDDAIAQLKEALALDPKRIDVALELAITYQNNNRETEAMASYDKLLADPGVPIVARANAGKWFARKNALAKAAAQGDAILAVEPDNAAGMYLKGEGLMIAGKWQEARVILTKASDADQGEAQYLDALGRAFEGSLKESEDTKFIESARYAYERATKVDPTFFHSQLGLGHMLVVSSKYREAIPVLNTAIGIDKTSADVMYWMGSAYYGVRADGPAQKKTCADWLESALKAQPALVPELRAEAGYKLADVYFDLNKASDAARSLENGIREAEELQKSTGKRPDWLVESYYRLGEIYDLLHNKSGQKKYWQKYVDSNPKPSARTKEALNALATELRNY